MRALRTGRNAYPRWSGGTPSITLIVALALAPGCGLTVGQRDAAFRFGHATAGIGRFVGDELPRLRADAIEMNTQSVTIGGAADPRDLDGAFDPEDVMVRVAAAGAIESYGALLVALVEETQAEELSKAANDFVDGMKGVADKRLSDAQYEALGELVVTIGGLFVERMKAQAIRRIVPEVKDDIDRICDLLTVDFELDQLGLGQDLDTTSRRLKADADLVLARNARSADRVLAVEAWRQAQAADARLGLVASEATRSLAALKAANAALAAALADDSRSVEDVRQLGKQVKRLADAARTLTGRSVER